MCYPLPPHAVTSLWAHASAAAVVRSGPLPRASSSHLDLGSKHWCSARQEMDRRELQEAAQHARLGHRRPSVCSPRNLGDGARAHGHAEAAMLSAVHQHFPAILASRCDQEPKVPPLPAYPGASPHFPFHIPGHRERLVPGVWPPLMAGHLSHCRLFAEICPVTEVCRRHW